MMRCTYREGGGRRKAEHGRRTFLSGPDTSATGLRSPVLGRSKASMFFSEKPFSDVRRQRYDETWSRRGLHGHTGRRMCSCMHCQQCFEPKLNRTHGENLFYNKQFGHVKDPENRLTRPYACTEFEMRGGRASSAPTSMHRHRAWEVVPELLAEQSIAAPEVSSDKNGMSVTAYHIETTHEQLPDPQVARHAEFLRTKIFEVVRGRTGRTGRPRLWATLATEAPEGIDAPLLPFARLHCASSTHSVPVGSIVRNRERSWDVGLSGNRPLDIDLGATCLISHFSTQGRHPSTRLYPRVRIQNAVGQLCSSGKGAVLVEDQPDHPPDEPFTGATWTVLMSRADVEAPNLPPPLAWVARYELLWRADGGRAWNSLGEFRGNVDPTTEVAHYFGDMHGGGLRARYLRVRPLECEGEGAMRLGVYGTPLYDTGHVQVAGQTGKTVVRDDATPQYVTFFLTQRRPLCNQRFSRRNPMYQGGRRKHLGGYERPGRRACYTREEVLAEIDEMEQAAVEAMDVLAHNVWLDENECAGDCDGYCGEEFCRVRLACAPERFGGGHGAQAGAAGHSGYGGEAAAASHNAHVDASLSTPSEDWQEEEWCIV